MGVGWIHFKGETGAYSMGGVLTDLSENKEKLSEVSRSSDRIKC